jgi:hypothetical protein
LVSSEDEPDHVVLQLAEEPDDQVVLQLAEEPAPAPAPKRRVKRGGLVFLAPRLRSLEAHVALCADMRAAKATKRSHRTTGALVASSRAMLRQRRELKAGGVVGRTRKQDCDRLAAQLDEATVGARKTPRRKDDRTQADVDIASDLALIRAANLADAHNTDERAVRLAQNTVAHSGFQETLAFCGGLARSMCRKLAAFGACVFSVRHGDDQGGIASPD